MSEDRREHIERMERQMAFIVEQQAQYEVRSAKADERWAEADKRWAETDKRWAEADKRWAKADERWARTEESIRNLLAIAQLHEGEFEELREAGKAIDERLSVLINVVERHISDGHNHKRVQE
jgi:chromosome segregation ATPase